MGSIFLLWLGICQSWAIVDFGLLPDLFSNFPFRLHLNSRLTCVQFFEAVFLFRPTKIILINVHIIIMCLNIESTSSAEQLQVILQIVCLSFTGYKN